ncbi:hypothetical protein E2C01_009519 [Portunus trituberculatus]|uniref:Uncharacterized protein n=1 Tax=Portunus trituberculatus TaxID=210409 RepID=A0A5B7D608_PORTR|nr:hypothetical protein [Portunus trituberculatus]
MSIRVPGESVSGARYGRRGEAGAMTVLEDVREVTGARRGNPISTGNGGAGGGGAEMGHVYRAAVEFHGRGEHNCIVCPGKLCLLWEIGLSQV